MRYYFGFVYLKKSYFALVACEESNFPRRFQDGIAVSFCGCFDYFHVDVEEFFGVFATRSEIQQNQL